MDAHDANESSNPSNPEPEGPELPDLSWRFGDSRPDPFLGQDLSGYMVDAVLGRGGFATVYRGHDAALNRPVAIKVLNDPLNEHDLKLFQREAKVIAALGKHAGIVQIFHWGERQHVPYFVLELVERSALDLLREAPAGVPPAVALRICAECADALAYAHERDVLHRDVKPANILIEAGTGQAKLSDFGLARLQMPSGSSITIGIGGSPPYMSPEQAEGRPVDGRSDVFSLGVTLYKLLSGHAPFDGDSPIDIMQNIRENCRTPLHERRPDLPREFSALIERATAHDPAVRFQTAKEFAGVLREMLAAVERREPLPLVERPVQSRPRRNALALAAGIAIVVGAALSAPLLLGGGVMTGEAAAAATQKLEGGEFQEAESLFREAVAADSGHVEALYGLGYSLLHQARLAEARDAFDHVPDANLRTEGLAAVEYEEHGADARSAIEQLRPKATAAYLDTLLAKIDLLEARFDDAIRRLESSPMEDYRFRWQIAEALNTLGQAYYNRGNYTQAQGTFEHLRAIATPRDLAITGAYLEATRRQLDAAHRNEVQERAQHLAEQIAQGVRPEPFDAWTSRPLTFFVLPVLDRDDPFMRQSGLTDVMPMLLGDHLDADTPMELVDRDLIHEVLQEQELASLVSTDAGALALGHVLGARLILRAEFQRLGDNRKIAMRLVDVETTTRVPVEAVPIARHADLEKSIAALADATWQAVDRAYPLQARLYLDHGAPTITIGERVGLRPGTAFAIYADPDVQALAHTATVSAVRGADSAEVSIAPTDLVDALPSAAGEGLYVRETPPDA